MPWPPAPPRQRPDDGWPAQAVLQTPVHAGEVTAGNLAITQAWSRATPGGAQVAGGYLTIENKGSQPDRLLSASTNAAKKIEIHEMALDKGIMTIPIDGGLFIEAGKMVKFEPGGRHLMLIGLAAPLAEGEQVRYRWRSSAPVR